MSQAEELLNAVAEDTITGITWDGTYQPDEIYWLNWGNPALRCYCVSGEIPKRHTYAAGATLHYYQPVTGAPSEYIEYTVKPVDSTTYGNNAYELVHTFKSGNTTLFAIVLTEEYYDEDTGITHPAGTYFKGMPGSGDPIYHTSFLQTFAINGANDSLVSNDDDPHIVIGPDKIVTVPEALKKIAVQHDHNIETVTFDCPRYWDGIDFATNNAPPSGKYSWDGDILGLEGFYKNNTTPSAYVPEYYYKVSSEVPASSVYDAGSDGVRYSAVLSNASGGDTPFTGDGLTEIVGGYELWSTDGGEQSPYAIIITSEENDYGVTPGVYFCWLDGLYISSLTPAVPVTGVATIVNDFAIYINYMLPGSGELGSYVAKNLRVDADNPELIHFDWTISSNVTKSIGAITFLVCARKVGVDGTVLHKWNSELCRDLRVSEGLETVETIVETQPDFITQVLTTLDRFNQSEYGQVVTRIEKLEGAVNYGEDGDGNVASEDLNLAARMKTAETDINTLEEGMRSANSNIETLDTRVTDTETDIDTNTQNISGLDTRVSALGTRVSALGTRVGDAESDIDALKEITGAIGEGSALGIDRGGTGATTAEAARANLGFTDEFKKLANTSVYRRRFDGFGDIAYTGGLYGTETAPSRIKEECGISVMPASVEIRAHVEYRRHGPNWGILSFECRTPDLSEYGLNYAYGQVFNLFSLKKIANILGVTFKNVGSTYSSGTFMRSDDISQVKSWSYVGNIGMYYPFKSDNCDFWPICIVCPYDHYLLGPGSISLGRHTFGGDTGGLDATWWSNLHLRIDNIYVEEADS